MVDEESGSDIILIRSENPMRGLASFEVRDDEDTANANLMAAAPDMLDACKRALSESEEGLTIGCVEDLRAAIEKAEGHNPDLNP